MENSAILDELLALLEQNNVAIRTEAMGGGAGGLCKIKNKLILFIDSDGSVGESAIAAADAVLTTIDMDSTYIKPQVREFIEKHKIDQ